MGDSTVQQFREKLKNASSDPKVKAKIDERDMQRVDEIDRYAMCFINWSKGDVDAAVNLTTDVLKWRKERGIHDLSVEDIDEEFLKRGVIYIHGKATDGTRLVYFHTRLQTKEVKAQVQNILCLWLERLQQQELGQHITFLLDVSKANMSNVDLGGIKFLLECFTKYFPDMLERIIILEMPWIMNAVWKIVKQWMTEEQRQRTIFCGFKNLAQYIDQDNILTFMGGKDNFEYKYPPDADAIPNLFLKASGGTPAEMSSEDCDSVQGESIQDEEEQISAGVESTSSSSPLLTEQEKTSPSKNLNAKHNKEATEDVVQTDDSATNAMKLESTPKKLLSPNGYATSASPQSPFETNLKPMPSAAKTEAQEHLRVTRKESERENKKIPQITVTPSPVSNEINLKSLLIMSPKAEVVFQEDVKDPRSGRHQSVITLTNPSQDKTVAFKIKTNSPERYHVKPSSGVVSAGEVLTVRINLSPGHEDAVGSDRFLILYQTKEDDEDVTEFWKSHVNKGKRFEHRVRVRFGPQSASDSELPPTVPVSSSGRTNSVALQSISAHNNDANQSSTDAQLDKLSREISGLKAKLMLSEYEATRFRTRLKYSAAMQGVMLLILLFVVYKLSLLYAITELRFGLNRNS